jgi:hypothetical protein
MKRLLLVLCLVLAGAASFAEEETSVFGWVPPDGSFVGILHDLDLEYRLTMGRSDLRVATSGLPWVSSLFTTELSAYDRLRWYAPVGGEVGWVFRPFDGDDGLARRAVGFGLSAHAKSRRMTSGIVDWPSGTGAYAYREFEAALIPVADFSFTINNVWRVNAFVPVGFGYGLSYRVVHEVVRLDERARDGFGFTTIGAGGVSVGRSF